MKILLSPQIRDANKIWYEIEGQKITATINGVSDTFDFTDMPDGVLQFWDENENEIIKTTLYDNPIISAKKENGELFVEIVFSISMEEEDERLLFPDWMTLNEFNNLMNELAEREKGVEADGEDGLEGQ